MAPVSNSFSEKGFGKAPRRAGAGMAVATFSPAFPRPSFDGPRIWFIECPVPTLDHGMCGGPPSLDRGC